MATESILDNAKDNLVRLQSFDVSTLSRESDFGTQLNFSAAVRFAQPVIDIYSRIPLNALDDLTDNQLNLIISETQTDYNLFSRILAFNFHTNDVIQTRAQILIELQNRRDNLFDILWQYIAYGVAKNTNAIQIETQAQAMLQSINNQSTILIEQLNSKKNEADNVLTAIREVASEQGVSQQAIYFKQEAENQEKLATIWLKYTYGFAIGLGIFAIISLFLHKWEWMKPENNAEMFQLVSSKLLIFAVLGYMLMMASKNYATYKHNSVINRHRQNALLTYCALVEAASNNDTGDIVLAHAASCIFSPQETGFNNRKGETSSGSNSILELLINRASNNTP